MAAMLADLRERPRRRGAALRPPAWRRAALLPAALLAAALALGPAGAARADFDHESYRPATFSGVLGEFGDELDKALADEHNIVIEARISKYRVLVTYRGDTRRIDAGTREFIDTWGRSLPQVPREYLALFRRELFVEAEGRTYWVPAQAQLMPFIDTELAAGDPLYLYVIFIGVGNKRPIFLVNEFSKAQVQ
jgi:hypothetical protein